MAEDSDLEKTEAASPQRLNKAREEGQVARSRELNTCLILLAGAMTLWVSGGFLYGRLVYIMRTTMHFDWTLKSAVESLAPTMLDSFLHALTGLFPLFVILVVVAIGSSVALGGLVFSSKALTPNFGRMNLFKGLGRMVSASTWIELLKTLLKAAVIGGVGIMVIKSYLPQMLALSHLSLPRALAQGMEMVMFCCATIIGSLLLIALIDVPWQMYSHAKKLRMSKEEVKREHKENEGDPHIKGRIRQQQREMARHRMMSSIPDADVVVTNPTHYAVALKYEQDGDRAPLVIAKGTGEIARKIREIAAENNVVQLEAPALARALYANVELEQPIPEALFAAVAQVLAWVYQLQQYRQGMAEEPDRPVNLPVPPELDPQSGQTQTTAR